VPTTLRGSRDGEVLLALPASAPGLAEARRELGADNVVVCGDDELDIAALVTRLHERGWSQVLTEGGPHLLGSFLASGRLDELCFTISPLVVGGEHRRPVGPDGTPTALDVGLLVEEDGTLMGRWFVRR